MGLDEHWFSEVGHHAETPTERLPIKSRASEEGIVGKRSQKITTEGVASHLSPSPSDGNPFPQAPPIMVARRAKGFAEPHGQARRAKPWSGWARGKPVVRPLIVLTAERAQGPGSDAQTRRAVPPCREEIGELLTCRRRPRDVWHLMVRHSPHRSDCDVAEPSSESVCLRRRQLCSRTCDAGQRSVLVLRLRLRGDL